MGLGACWDEIGLRMGMGSGACGGGRGGACGQGLRTRYVSRWGGVGGKVSDSHGRCGPSTGPSTVKMGRLRALHCEDTLTSGGVVQSPLGRYASAVDALALVIQRRLAFAPPLRLVGRAIQTALLAVPLAAPGAALHTALRTALRTALHTALLAAPLLHHSGDVGIGCLINTARFGDRDLRLPRCCALLGAFPLPRVQTAAIISTPLLVGRSFLPQAPPPIQMLHCRSGGWSLVLAPWSLVLIWLCARRRY